MATKKAVKKTFSITAKITVTVSKDVIADTLEQAIERARTYKHLDFVTISPNSYIDYEPLKIKGVWENS